MDMDDIAQHPSAPSSSANQSQDSSTTVRLVPVTETFVVPSPWYKRVFGPVTRTETVWKLTFLSLIVVGIIVGQSMIQTPTNTVTQAAVGTARVTLYPQTAQIPPDKSFQLWITVDKPVKEAKIVLSFDPSVLQIGRDITLVGKSGYQISVTPKGKANQSGSIEFLLSPQPGAVPLAAGTIQIGSIYMTTRNKPAVTSATISLNEGETSILNQDSVPFSLSSTDVTVTLK